MMRVPAARVTEAVEPLTMTPLLNPWEGRALLTGDVSRGVVREERLGVEDYGYGTRPVYVVYGRGWTRDKTARRAVQRLKRLIQGGAR